MSHGDIFGVLSTIFLLGTLQEFPVVVDKA